MTRRILSPQALCAVLDALAEGHQIRDAMASVGGSENTFWEWKRDSKRDFDDFDFSRYYIRWHARQPAFFHEYLAIAQTPPRTPLPVKDDGELFETPTKPQSTGPFPVMSELRLDLEQKLREARQNPNRITRPQGNVHIMRDAPDDAQREKINAPSDQRGLPTRLPEQRQSGVTTPAAPDYSRRAPARLDTSDMRGPPPPGGFRVA
jgi:hypothetical protein